MGTEPSLKCEREDSKFLLMDNPRLSESENVMLSMDKEEEVDIDEMILQAKTLNSNLLTLLDKKKHDKSMAQTKLQEIQKQNCDWILRMRCKLFKMKMIGFEKFYWKKKIN